MIRRRRRWSEELAPGPGRTAWPLLLTRGRSALGVGSLEGAGGSVKGRDSGCLSKKPRRGSPVEAANADYRSAAAGRVMSLQGQSHMVRHVLESLHPPATALRTSSLNDLIVSRLSTSLFFFWDVFFMARVLIRCGARSSRLADMTALQLLFSILTSSTNVKYDYLILLEV